MTNFKCINKHEVSELLPGYNCGICGYARCEEFAGAILKKYITLEKCRFLLQEIYAENLTILKSTLKEENTNCGR